MWKKAFLVCFGLFSLSTVYCKLPEYIKTCKRNDPNMAECLKTAVNHLKPKLKVGIPEINAPALEPLSLNNVSIISGSGIENGFRAFLYNVKVHEASVFEIVKIKANVETLTFRANLRMPRLRIVADYDINGKILFLPIRGNGKFYANATDTLGRAVFKIRRVKDTGVLDPVDIQFKVTDYKVYLDNLFDGDEVLGKATNAVINDNKEEFLNIVLPELTQQISKIFTDFGNKIISSHSYDELLPL